MNKSFKNNIYQDFNKGLFQSLLKNIPPKKNSPHLEDIINVLLNALEEGELQVQINKNTIPSIELSCSGWPKAHMKALLDSGWLDGSEAPIIIKEDKISFSRWDYDMQKVINDLIKRSVLPRNYKLLQESKLTKNRLLNKEQQLAVEAINIHGVILISGGPGTGKTSTLTNILESALSLNPSIRIGLAAPTGKATRRLRESIQASISTISSIQRPIISNLPCKTLHSWLLAMPLGFKRNKWNLIPLDLLIIDEMSMVDIELMQGLLNALPLQSQLVLVGDPQQLPPVNSGAVWHYIQEKRIREKFGGAAIHLEKLYRNEGELASLSLLLRKKGISSFWEALNQIPEDSNFQRYSFRTNEVPRIVLETIESQHKKLTTLTKSLTKYISEDLIIKDLNKAEISVLVEELLIQANDLLVLCPQRRGIWGVNQIHKALLKNNFEKGLDHWPQGTPIMCSENQPELGLSNGDIGILIGETKKRKVIFRILSQEGESAFQLIHPARLKSIEPALALTIHKAQGSEAQEVILLWPNKPNQPFINAEESSTRKTFETRLLYTAITRAKQKVNLISK